jgi:hypothetical protein
MADVHVAQLGGQASKVSCRVNSEAQSKRTVEAQKKGNYNDNVGVGGVREEVGETLMEGLVAKLEIEPESYGVPIARENLGDGVEMSKPSHNIFPDGTVEVMVPPTSRRRASRTCTRTRRPGGARCQSKVLCGILQGWPSFGQGGK